MLSILFTLNLEELKQFIWQKCQNIVKNQKDMFIGHLTAYYLNDIKLINIKYLQFLQLGVYYPFIINCMKF